jgi:Ni,Fe-hydrogenase maturation factor
LLYTKKRSPKLKAIAYFVIGYGNTLRSDDGVGQIIAKQIARWNLPNV